VFSPSSDATAACGVCSCSHPLLTPRLRVESARVTADMSGMYRGSLACVPVPMNVDVLLLQTFFQLLQPLCFGRLRLEACPVQQPHFTKLDRESEGTDEDDEDDDEKSVSSPSMGPHPHPHTPWDPPPDDVADELAFALAKRECRLHTGVRRRLFRDRDRDTH
jgi:hypothetical protein